MQFRSHSLRWQRCHLTWHCETSVSTEDKLRLALSGGERQTALPRFCNYGPNPCSPSHSCFVPVSFNKASYREELYWKSVLFINRHIVKYKYFKSLICNLVILCILRICTFQNSFTKEFIYPELKSTHP